MKEKPCPIKLDTIHCQNCYFSRDGKCRYAEMMEYEVVEPDMDWLDSGQPISIDKALG